MIRMITKEKALGIAKAWNERYYEATTMMLKDLYHPGAPSW